MKEQKIVEVLASQIEEENKNGWYVKQVIDHFVDKSGSIPTWNHLFIVLMEKENQNCYEINGKRTINKRRFIQNGN